MQCRFYIQSSSPERQLFTEKADQQLETTIVIIISTKGTVINDIFENPIYIFKLYDFLKP